MFTKRELPELMGTEKQVNWAYTIRHNLLNDVDADLTKFEAGFKKAAECGWKIDYKPEHVQKALDMIRSQESAAWWIDHKCNYLVLRDTVKEVYISSMSKKAVVMKAAWAMAKKAAAKFGGSSRMYFAESLRIAWANARA